MNRSQIRIIYDGINVVCELARDSLFSFFVRVALLRQ